MVLRQVVAMISQDVTLGPRTEFVEGAQCFDYCAWGGIAYMTWTEPHTNIFAIDIDNNLGRVSFEVERFLATGPMIMNGGKDTAYTRQIVNCKIVVIVALGAGEITCLICSFSITFVVNDDFQPPRRISTIIVDVANDFNLTSIDTSRAFIVDYWIVIVKTSYGNSRPVIGWTTFTIKYAAIVIMT
jgi:hypothetical protein